MIVQPPDNFTKPLFEAVNLTCAADGYPPPVFKWYRDGVLIPNAVQSFYYIDQLTPDLRGYYTCEAINNQDDVTSSPGLVTIQSEFICIMHGSCCMPTPHHARMKLMMEQLIIRMLCLCNSRQLAFLLASYLFSVFNNFIPSIV